MAELISLPIIDLSPYLEPKAAGDQEKVINEVKEACCQFGFFQVKGHGLPLSTQHALLQAMDAFFRLPSEEKQKLSFLKNPGRRGYEASGMSMRVGDALPDSKEAFYIGRENPVVEPPGYHCPNVWPDIPEEQFQNPVWEYYQETASLGKTIWEILLLGLDRSPSIMETFAKRPVIPMKMIRYPPVEATVSGQYGVGPHTDFGGVTVLLQEAGKVGLEIYHNGEWLPVPSIEDVLVINCGDMIQAWSGNVYKSAKHRVINRANSQRLSCATFWHGDLEATNPLDPSDPNKETIKELLFKRFGSQFSLTKVYGKA